MSSLTRDGTAKPIWRDQILGANGDREMLIFPVQLTTIHTLAVSDDYTYIHLDRKQWSPKQSFQSCLRIRDDSLISLIIHDDLLFLNPCRFREAGRH